MSYIIANERGMVLRACGYPDTAEISASQVDEIFHHEALDWLNHRRPAIGLAYFTTVADQQDYSSKPAGAYRVVEVWWEQAGVDTFSPDLSYIPSTMYITTAFAGFDVFHNPSIAAEFYKKVSEFAHTFEGRGWETPEGKIRLEPAPTGTGDKVYFEYSYPRFATIHNVPIEYQPAVRDYVASIVMQVLTIRRGNVTGGKNYSSGGGAKEDMLRKEFLAKAEAQVPYLDQTIYRG